MKIKKRTLKRTLKYIVSFVLLLSLFSNLPLISIWAQAGSEAAVAAASSTQAATIEEGVYLLRNVGNGQYLDVDNNQTAVGTTLATYFLHGQINQLFRVIHIADNTYKIAALNALPAGQDELYIAPKAAASGTLLEINTTGDTFRFTQASDNRYIIYTEDSGYTAAICMNVATPNRIVHTTYDTLSDTDKAYAQWELQPYDFTGEHEYHNGVVDGGVYFLRNLGNGQYLDVDNNQTAAGTMLATYYFHGEINQQFRLEYVGDDIYRIVPMNSPSLYVCVGWSSPGSVLNLSSLAFDYGGYKLKAVAENTYVLYTESSDFETVVCMDTSQPNRIVHKTYDTLNQNYDLPYALWALERVDTQYDAYDKYFIRHEESALYLTSNPNIHAARAEAFVGTEAQQWKRVCTSLDRYDLSPMYNQYRYLNIANGSVTVKWEGQISSIDYRTFILENAVINEQGDLACNIAAYLNGEKKYLNVGIAVLDDPNSYSVLFSNKAEGNDVWVFEKTPTTSPSPYELTLNQWRNDTILANEGEVKWFSFAVDKDARYKIELSGSDVVIGTVESIFPATELNRKTYKGVKIVDVFLQDYISSFSETDPATIYCIPIVFNGTATGTTSTFSVRVRQLSLVAHSDDDIGGPEGDAYMSRDIDAIQDSLQDMNFHLTHKEEITATQALTSTDPLTGYRDFNADIFVYAGHADPGKLIYEITYGSNESEDVADIFYSLSLPEDMSNCELVVWNCCYSALDEPEDDFDNDGIIRNCFTRESIKNSAKTAIGFSEAINTLCARYFIDILFEELSKGYCVQQATINARASLLRWVDYQANIPSEKAITLVEHMQIWGDPNNVIFPCEEVDSIITASANNTIYEAATLFNRANYTLIADNPTSGVKRYVRMINGISTDDYFVEFYVANQLVQIYKSPTILTEQEEPLANSLWTQYTAFNSTTQAESDLSETELIFTHIDDELRLLRKEIILAEGQCECQAEYVYYDAITNEVIQWQR